MWGNSKIFQCLWDALMIGVCLVDRAGYIIRMNLTGSRLLGWGAAFPTHLPCHDVLECLIPSEEDGKEICPLSGLLLEKTMLWSPRTRLRNRQGGWCWVELKSIVVNDVEISGYLMMFRDLSSEIQLTEESRRLASIPHENPFPVIEVDATGQLLYANPSMMRLMEKSQIGQDGFSTALPERFPDLAARCFSQGQLESHIEVDVGGRHYSWTFSPHPELGLLRGYGMDITEPKRAADELSVFAETLETKNQELDRALIKAESATRAKAAFLAVMSHEIRTPLNGVIGMAELLLQSSLDHEQQECAKIIRLSGEGLLEIINDILDFSKIESGQLKLETIGFTPQTLLEEVVDLFSERAHRKGLDVAAYVDPEVPDQLTGDPHRLRQILSNYLSNALKFTMKGSVLVRVTRREHELQEQDEVLMDPQCIYRNPGDGEAMWIRFSVQDTGLGMSEDVQRKIFQVFTQADSSMSRQYGGSGLGLAICKQLAELMQGMVGVRSRPNQGSTFWCDIPFRAPKTRGGATRRVGTVKRKEMLILCPLKATAWVLSQLLNEMGVGIVEVENLYTAQQLLEQQHDRLPHIEGIIVGAPLNEGTLREWVEHVRSSPLLRHIKIWSLKPFWLRKNDESISSMLDGVITLPIHSEQFSQCIKSDNGLQPTLPPLAHSEKPIFQKFTTQTDDGRSLPSRESVGPSVLVVEDNPVNQQVALGMLQKLGCQVILVETGKQALHKLQEGDVDCIVMDWELPEMDGLAITRRIREMEESGTLVHKPTRWRRLAESPLPPDDRIPILGMTAHVLPEHGEQCLMSGMDTCLSKPVHLQDLKAALQQWVGWNPGGTAIPCSRKSKAFLGPAIGHQSIIQDQEMPHGQKSFLDIPAGFDLSSALQALEGDEVLLHSLLTLFNDTAPSLVQEMEKAVHRNDRQDLQRLAHQIKGALHAVHAVPEAALAGHLETVALSADLPSLQATTADLGQVICTLINGFQKLLSVRESSFSASLSPHAVVHSPDSQ